MSLARRLLDRVRRAVLGLSPEEVRYTFEDVRAEIRAVRAELKAEIAEVRVLALRQAEGEREGRSARAELRDAEPAVPEHRDGKSAHGDARDGEPARADPSTGSGEPRAAAEPALLG